MHERGYSRLWKGIRCHKYCISLHLQALTYYVYYIFDRRSIERSCIASLLKVRWASQYRPTASLRRWSSASSRRRRETKGSRSPRRKRSEPIKARSSALRASSRAQRARPMNAPFAALSVSRSTGPSVSRPTRRSVVRVAGRRPSTSSRGVKGKRATEPASRRRARSNDRKEDTYVTKERASLPLEFIRNGQ